MCGSHWPIYTTLKRDRSYNIKSVTMIDPVTGWFEITQYNGKKAMTITNLLETMWLVLYPRPVKITFDRGG